jgi:uncharacterized protein YbcC (UPF0753/DUF2309 family)
MTTSDVEPLLADIERAGATVPPSWPLSSTIAVNPLAGFEDRPFAQGVEAGADLFGGRGLLTLEEYRRAHQAGRVTHDELVGALGRWHPDRPERDRDALLRDLTDGPSDPDPRRGPGTVAEWCDDRDGTALATELRRVLAEHCLRGDLPPGPLDQPVAADDRDRLAEQVSHALHLLGVPTHRRRSYLERHLTLLPGWVAHLRWRERAGQPHVLLRFLAVSLATEAALVAGRGRFDDIAHPAGPVEGAGPGRLSEPDRLLIWQDAYERGVHDAVLASLAEGPVGPPPAPAVRPDAQVVCCIDVRSEPLRRHLEALGGYETFGYAGFFGLAARVEPVGGGRATDRCPVLIEPTATIAVREPQEDRVRLAAATGDAWKATKQHPVAPLALADAAGWLAGPLAAARTLLPGRFASGRFASGRFDARTAPVADVGAVTLEDRADVVAGVLRLGLGPAPAPLVVLCGHTSRSVNNPTESGLTCGACGGHGGGVNAVAVAAMANDPRVRDELARRGLTIPADTWFLAAEHDTSVDRVALLGVVPDSHRHLVDRLERDVAAAGDAVTRERAARLPGTSASVRRVRRRAADWAEPVPELGLAGNAAFLVGPRWLSAGADLAGRVFLHSYEPDADPDGRVLAGILTAPLVVAQWINAQYHFSTTDPEVYGSGSKALHNVVGDVGVLSGPGGDLRRGLSLQSVRAGDRLLHEPVRLLAVVHGRFEHVDAAIATSPTLGRLVENGWIHLVARPPGGDGWRQRTATGWEDRLVAAVTRPTREVAA